MMQEDYKYLRNAIAILDGVEGNVTGWEYGLIGGANDQLKGVVEDINEEHPDWEAEYNEEYGLN